MKYLRLIAILIVLLCIVLFIRATDMEKVIASLQRVGYNFLLLIAISFSSYFMGTVAWRYCMGNEGKHLPLGELFIIRHVGETVGVINPASIVAGEAVKVYLLRNHAIQRSTVVTSVLLSRILMVLTQILAFLLVAVYMLINSTVTLSSIRILLYALLGAGITVTLLIKFKQPVCRMLIKIRFGVWLSNRTAGIRHKAAESMTALSAFYRTNTASLAKSVLFFLLHWALGSLELFVILRLLDVPVTFLPAMFVDMSVIIFKSFGAFVPAQVGIEEYGNKVMLAAIGFTALETWLTASVLRRARQLFWIAFGLVAYLFTGRKKACITYQPDGDPVCKP